jgi:hypothetical protein
MTSEKPSSSPAKPLRCREPLIRKKKTARINGRNSPDRR